ncbi:hypothetical protein ACFL1B_04125 [Nanoarchaeota archaeon]
MNKRLLSLALVASLLLVMQTTFAAAQIYSNSGCNWPTFSLTQPRIDSCVRIGGRYYNGVMGIEGLRQGVVIEPTQANIYQPTQYAVQRSYPTRTAPQYTPRYTQHTPRYNYQTTSNCRNQYSQSYRGYGSYAGYPGYSYRGGREDYSYYGYRNGYSFYDQRTGFPNYGPRSSSGCNRA